MNTIRKKPTKFHEAIATHQIADKRDQITILQLNLGKKCNQSCMHCHVDAGPSCNDMMCLETINRILTLLDRQQSIKTVDITGGAPELNPHFRYLVKNLRKRGYEVIDRCNLTVLFEKGQEETAEFLAKQGVMIIASLPCYLEANVDNQRGSQTYNKSIQALQRLNQLGYGKTGSGLRLNLVFNPSGMGLPPAQEALERDYKQQLSDMHQIEFNRLLTITNMPIKRFRTSLENAGQLDRYEALLVEKFNPAAAQRIMCRDLISISWDGKIYDCDFNQALQIPVHSARTIWEIEALDMVDSEIVFGNHCYGCTAGSGSSCSGALI